MEKLICTACGAPLTPDTATPFLTCEYCDTAIENKYYVEPAPAPVKELETPETVQEVVFEEESASRGSVLGTLLGVGTAIAGSALRKRSRTTIARHVPAVRTAPVVRHAAPVHKPVRAAHAPQPRHPGPVAGPARSGMHPARPGRPAKGGGRGPGGRGPGGRGRPRTLIRLSLGLINM